MRIDYQDAVRRLNALAQGTGLSAALFDGEGRRLWVAETLPGSALCAGFCAVKEGLRRCAEFHESAGREAWRTGGPCAARCHAGMVALTLPLTDGNRYAGSAALMPLRLWAWDDAARAELCQRAQDLGLPEERLCAAGGDVPQITSARADALLDLMRECLSPSEDEGLRRAIDSQQRQIGDLIAARRQLLDGAPDAASARPHDYPIQLEREMLGRVRLGDKKGARAMLNELLAHIFLRSPGNLELIKARLLELVVMISRAAVESGAELDRLLGLNYNFISEAAVISDYEELSAWIVKVLDAFLDAVYESRGLSGSRQLTDALSYIRSHHMLNLTLEDVAAQVFVSPFYLSHMFKEKLGVTFVEYLTRVRVEMAKSYLLNTQLPVAAVAEKVGYEDASYFGKVFKRLTGATPKGFRRGE